ncbi:MAG: hypothetical protein HYU29_03125 [Chloroflexi bacterium]|nr:hypothetical protein [Chloroflexota bacterium]
MRSLSSTLAAAQKSSSGTPYVKVEVLDMVAGVARPIFEQLYSGSEPDFYHASTVAGDGSLVRARVNPGTGALYVQRVPNPGPGSNFSSWTFLNNVSAQAGIALCSRGSKVYLFFVDSVDNKSLYLRQSNDYGATWTGPDLVLLPSVDQVKWLAAAESNSSALALFYVSSTPWVYVTRRISGVWSTPSSWPHSLASITGIACVYQGDWNLMVTGRDSTANRAWTCIYGDGASQSPETWSGLKEIAKAETDSLVEFHTPFITYPDVFRCSFVEKYGGTASYSRALLAHTLPGTSFSDSHWREASPFNLSTSYGMALAQGGGNLWLSTPFRVWRGDLSGSPIDVTADVVDLRLEEGPQGARATVTLRNDHGLYNSPGSGSAKALHKGSETRISPGYRTGAGSEISSGPAFWITGWEHITGGGRSLLRVHAEDGWLLLRAWRARRQYSWSSGNTSVLDLIRFLVSQAGLDLITIATSSTITTLKPEFTVQPKERGSEAVTRLLNMVPDVLFFRGRQGLIKYPQGGDASDYSFGTDHPILEARYLSQALEVNRVQAYGRAGMVEVFAWDEVDQVYDRLLQINDLNLDTLSSLQERAEGTLTKEGWKALGGQVTVHPNCGQELYDVITITDGLAALSGARRRVLELQLQYEAVPRSRYVQQIRLGKV